MNEVEQDSMHLSAWSQFEEDNAQALVMAPTVVALVALVLGGVTHLMVFPGIVAAGMAISTVFLARFRYGRSLSVSSTAFETGAFALAGAGAVYCSWMAAIG